MLRDTARIKAPTPGRQQGPPPADEPPIEPLFADATRRGPQPPAGIATAAARALPGVALTFIDAGHILGAAMVLLELSEEGRRPGSSSPATWGGATWPSCATPRRSTGPTCSSPSAPTATAATGRRRVADRLAAVVGETAARGGKVIIPAFALGRTQEIVFNLHQLPRRAIPDMPVYVDSPLAMNATGIFRLHPEGFDAETNEHVTQREDPFGFSRLTYVRSADDSRGLNARRDPMVIIAASGMCEAGRVLHHLRHGVGDERNTILLVSWQAPHTLGRRLQEGEEPVRILGEEHVRRARVEKIQGFSAHADREGLIELVGSTAPSPGHLPGPRRGEAGRDVRRPPRRRGSGR